MNKNIPLIVAGIVFALVALAHLLRLIYGAEITISGHIVSMAGSYLAFIVTLILSIWMFVSTRNK